MSSPNGLTISAPIPQSRSRLLPVIDLSPPPEYIGSMEELMPAPLKARSKSPSAGPSRKWESFSTRERNARSKSPQSQRLPAHIRARTPELERSRTPDSLQSKTPKTATGSPDLDRTTSAPRYNIIPRGYINNSSSDLSLRKTGIRQKFGHKRNASASSVTSTISIDSTRSAPPLHREPSSPIIINRGRPTAHKRSASREAPPPRLELPSIPLPQLTLQPPTARKPRERVPSMIDYLSMEQLESLWQSQDIFAGPIVVPQNIPASPLWRNVPEDPRSPMPFLSVGGNNDFSRGLDVDRLRVEMGLVSEHQLGIHPAFRDRSPLHSTFVGSAF